MNDNEIKEKLKKEKGVIFIDKIKYNEKLYVKTIKQLPNGIEYLYYEITNNEIKEINDKETLTYLQEENDSEEATNMIY